MIAIHLLSRLGYHVTASCGSQHLWHKLKMLGANETIGRLDYNPDKPLESGRWDGVVDAAGGDTLAAALAQTRRHGCVAASGNAAGSELQATVYPFILRGVVLVGVDSNTADRDQRALAWLELAEMVADSDAESLLISTVGISQVPALCSAKLRGEAPGRFLVDHSRA